MGLQATVFKCFRVFGQALDNIQLPAIICTVPSLDENHSGEYDLKKAARSIFLTLNKSARPVTRTRNLLLDDNDMISYFMRKTLSSIKNQSDRSNSLLEIHCVELDQDSDKQKISNPIALTGVSHCYYIIEHLMLNKNEEVNGVSNRSGRFSNRITNEYISRALDRLEAFDLLGQDARNELRRDFFTTEQIDKLSEVYENKYGKYISHTLDKLSIYQCHNKAARRLKEELGSHQDIHLKPMLFEGQGMIRTFESHRENLTHKLKNAEEFYENEVPRIRAIKSNLDTTDQNIKNAIDSFEKYRALELFSRLSQNKITTNGEINEDLLKFCNKLYRNTFTTVAFQSALICGFFDELEKVFPIKEINGNIQDIYNEYLESIGSFLKPDSIHRYKTLLNIFEGYTKGTDFNDFDITDNKYTFRDIVYPNEMQPDAWPAYKYLFLEMWRKQGISNEKLNKSVSSTIADCRKQILNDNLKKNISEFLKENLIKDEDMTREQRENCKKKTLESYKYFLANFGQKSEISNSDFD